jgi:ribosomal-protein-alanine N-acetyltransferase
VRAGVVVRRAGVGDIEAMLQVQEGAKGAPVWSEAIWRELFVDADVARAGFVIGGEDVVGFIVVNCVAGVAEMESVAVVESMRRRGLGKALCETAMAWARGCGAGAMELEVRASSAAVRMYQALGFEEQGRRAAYYREPLEDALLMRVAL